MDDIPSISTGTVGSRFVSQDEIETARTKRDEQWKAALGQEPPPQPNEEVYDGRSLAEKLAANKAIKQEEWESKNRLANQFRALEEDEVVFLDSVQQQQLEAERKRKQADSEEVKSFKEAVAAREQAAAKPPTAASPPAPAQAVSTTKAKTVGPSQKKASLKGVIKKKTSKPPATASTAKPAALSKATSGSTQGEEDGPPESKRRRVSEVDASSSETKS